MTWRNRITGYGEEKPDQLLANPRNWRIHPKAQQDALKSVLDTVGFIDDVIVNQRTGYIVDGHLRVAMAISEGQELMPVKYVDLSDEEERLMLASFDPIAAMAAADREKLGDLLKGIESGDAEVNRLLEAIARENKIVLREDIPAPEAQIDKAEELQKKWGTARGQIWEIPSKTVKGKAHRLMCADSTKAEAVQRLMGGEKAAACIADPPYGIAWNTDPKRSRGGPGYPALVGDNEPFDPAPLLQHKVIVLWGGNHYASRLPDSASWMVWDKRPSGYSNDQADCELAWTNLDGPARIFRHAWSGGGTLARENGTEQRSLHPTQKPTALLAWCIERTGSAVGTVILDPFLGSGTTMVAAEQLGRLCYGMEIEPKYVAVSLQRMADMGLEPRLTDGIPDA